MKHFNWEKYKTELKAREFLTYRNVILSLFAFTLFPYSARNGDIEVYAVLALMSLGLFCWPRYVKYIFHTKRHKVIVGISWLATSALAYAGYLEYGDLGSDPLYAKYGCIDFLALSSMIVALSTLCHSLATCGHEVEM